MRKRKISALLAIIMCILLIVNSAACGGNAPDDEQNEPSRPSGGGGSNEAPPDETEPDNLPEEPPEPKPVYPPPDMKLVEYNGVVEHIFFHEAIAYPELAFRGDSMQKGFDDNMVTVYEYNKILESLHRNNFILVDLNDVWSEYTDNNGAQRMQRNTLMLPEGKKPLVISFDDINYYNYMRSYGFVDKLIIGDDGDVWATGLDRSGNRIVTQDLSVITILDKFVKENPDFSLFGAKGCIALTGYEGILGYRTQTDANDNSAEFRLNRMQEVALVRPVVERLKETGWYFASHSYGHLRIASISVDRVTADAERWMNEVGSLVGETKIFIYPYGDRLDGGDVNQTGPGFRFYHDLGFRIFASVGREPYTKIKTDIAAVILDRMNSDGLTLRNRRERFMRFYDAAEVFDPARLDVYGTDW